MEERHGDARTALLHWRVVRAFLPEDPEAAGRVTALEREIRSEADGHLRKGKEKYEEGKYEEARREFLAALAFDPFLEEAAVYLKRRLARQDSRTYVARDGDTPRSVAREIYGDPGKDFLVAYFNGLDAGTPLRPGTRLNLPLLDIPLAGGARAPSRANAPVPSFAPAPAPPGGPSIPRPLARPANPDDSLDRARASFRSGEYKQAAALAEHVLEKSPASREARELRNAAYYQLGTEYLRRQEYPESLRMFQKVETSYKDQKTMVARVGSRLREEAESHYAAGVKRFLAEDLEDAAKEWETTLKLDPSHPKAKKDLERARRLLEQVRGMP
ncbi:MAG TPA: alkyl sulfatase dimerization domain-containing protein [Candidatus Methylomirabilis sp.]|nr:alkyl sulfatase dimerization domain-containing protein [Candidatus Methylomirabilis sp.]